MLYEENADASWKIIVDFYWVIAGIFALTTASWIGFVVFVLGIMWIIRMILKEKQKEEEEMIDKINKKQEWKVHQ